MKSTFLRRASAYALFFLFSAGLSNTFANTVYSVNRSIGVGGVSGYIETDGTIGILAANNVKDWQLTLVDDLDTFTLIGPDSGANSELFILGAAFSASATDLLFDFSGDSAQHVLFQNPNLGSEDSYWCFPTPFSVTGTVFRVVVGISAARTSRLASYSRTHYPPIVPE